MTGNLSDSVAVPADALRPLTALQWLGVGSAVLLLAGTAFALVFGLCYGLSAYAAWTPAALLASEAISAAAGVGVGVWMLRLALRAERAWAAA